MECRREFSALVWKRVGKSAWIIWYRALSSFSFTSAWWSSMALWFTNIYSTDTICTLGLLWAFHSFQPFWHSFAFCCPINGRLKPGVGVKRWDFSHDKSSIYCSFHFAQSTGESSSIVSIRKILTFYWIKIIFRFSRKIFWCIESLFHEKNTYERHQAMSKAAEHSPFELYHFLQSFFHSAPQIILQLFILLRDDLFRNYDTGDFILILKIDCSLNWISTF